MLEFNYYERYLRGALNEAKYYLMSKDLFWPLDLTHPLKKAPYPKLTIGNLLYFRYSTIAAAITSYHKQTINHADNQYQEIKEEWPVAWEEKAEMEFKSRIRQWSYYLKELKNNMESYAPYYPVEVRVRVLLQLLNNELKNKDKEQGKLAALDEQLKSIFNKSDFVWETGLKRAFPKKEFWYLYGYLG
jgi:hypothetical protein